MVCAAGPAFFFSEIAVLRTERGEETRGQSVSGVVGNSEIEKLRFEPIGSMYGIFTYIYHTNQPNVGKYTIHGWHGNGFWQRLSKGVVVRLVPDMGNTGKSWVRP